MSYVGKSVETDRENSK